MDDELLNDLRFYGRCFMKNGKRIDPRDIYIKPSMWARFTWWLKRVWAAIQ